MTLHNVLACLEALQFYPANSAFLQFYEHLWKEGDYKHSHGALCEVGVKFQMAAQIFALDFSNQIGLLPE